MKKDNEVEKETRETTALLKETLDVFARSFAVWSDSIVSELKQYQKKLRQESPKDIVINELTTIAESVNELLATMKQNSIRRARALKVVLHKKESHASDRLVAALNRMKRDAKEFQSKMQALAKAKKTD
jgi:GTPase involved in cell partitioning and DNA repair